MSLLPASYSRLLSASSPRAACSISLFLPFWIQFFNVQQFFLLKLAIAKIKINNYSSNSFWIFAYPGLIGVQPITPGPSTVLFGHLYWANLLGHSLYPPVQSLAREYAHGSSDSFGISKHYFFSGGCFLRTMAHTCWVQFELDSYFSRLGFEFQRRLSPLSVS